MDKPTKLKALATFPVMLIAMGAPLFLAARTFDYWQGWLFVLVFSIATTIHGIILYKYAPELLARRMKAGPTYEKRPVQRIIMTFVTITFFAFLVVGGFDHKLHWSSVAPPAVLFGDFLIAFSFVIFTKVCLENHYASATIELNEGQSVVSTGMYGIVRHPMYAGALVLMIGIPLAIASLWSAPLILITVGVLIWRISDEEKFLRSHLDGYTEYCQKVKYRLIPGVY